MINDRINRKSGSSEAMQSMQVLRNVSCQFQVMSKGEADSPESMPCTDAAMTTDFTAAGEPANPANVSEQDHELLSTTLSTTRPARVNSTVLDR
jgi:hypothetical protein